jgi:ubiquinone/menaquinone biosynthesis C-methylase UbiE
VLAVLGATPAEPLVGVDASAGMLDQARRKRWPGGVRFVHGRAEDVATLAADAAPLDGIFAAYLFRNVAERDATLAAVRELLAPGGTLVVQEYSVAGRPSAQAVWTAVCWLVVIPLALLTSGRARLYRYLWRSVLDFDSVERFSERLRGAGFTDVEVSTVGGWQRGILHTFAARRPA